MVLTMEILSLGMVMLEVDGGFEPSL
jgi:hypothetical protein